MLYLPSAPDLRDLWRRGSGMTLRRLGVMIQALPPDAPLWPLVRADEERRQQERKHAELERRANLHQRRSDG